MLFITDLDQIKEIENQVNVFHTYGGNATSSSIIYGFAQGSEYTSIIAESQVIAISSPSSNYSSSYSSVSSTAK